MLLRKSNFLLFAIALLLCEPAFAQSINIDFGGEIDSSITSRVIQIILLITVITLAPSLLIMVTSFVRIIVVLSFLRSALGLQQTPPNQVLVALALFLTIFIMMPVFEKSYQMGIEPLIEGTIDETAAMKNAAEPFHNFMMANVREKDLQLFTDIANTRPTEYDAPNDVPYHVLIPAFMISELKRAFEIGFMIFLPFLIIDMLISSVLMSMGMMMLPPILISLPFKLIFFVVIDGWYMIAGSLAKSYAML